MATITPRQWTKNGLPRTPFVTARNRSRLLALSISSTLVLCIAGPALAADTNSYCMREHLEDAIRLNLERRPLYAAESDQRSLIISDHLISVERQALLFNRIFGFDRNALPYQTAGVRLLCAEFVSMQEVPPFQSRGVRPWPDLGTFVPIDGLILARQLRGAWKQGGLDGLIHEAEVTIERLASEPRFHCMVRHVLESVIRAARLAPHHDRKARRLGLQSPFPLSIDFTISQLQGLKDAADLDAAAAPLQADGIPILCQDVPAIPTSPREEL